jgi:hypothetical protein
MPLSVPGSTVPKPKIAAVERRKAGALLARARAAACVKARRRFPGLRLSALCSPRWFEGIPETSAGEKRLHVMKRMMARSSRSSCRIGRNSARNGRLFLTLRPQRPISTPDGLGLTTRALSFAPRAVKTQSRLEEAGPEKSEPGITNTRKKDVRSH